MRNQNLTDTIAAVATGVGEAGIGIVRLSGKEALKIADQIFVSKDSKKPSTFKTYTIHYGWVKNGAEVVDEVILTVMRAPRSFTKEDVVEINCHGGIVALRAVLDFVLVSGARLAEPGEFTKRAFLNGRIDLAQAEAVLDIIRAKTDSSLNVSLEQLRGALSKEINQIRADLLDLLTLLEANLDFPDEEIGKPNLGEASRKLTQVKERLGILIKGAHKGRIFREGIHAVICGKPNVGKSSLLNALLKQERSIVTPIAGTTRDTIEEIIDIRGIPVRITDTAGIIEPKDLVEKKAVQRSGDYIRKADLVILLFDGSRKLGKDDATLVRKVKNKHTLAVINKIDLPQKIEKGEIGKHFKQVISLSAKKAKNIALLEEAIAGLVYQGEVPGPELFLVGNARHIEAVRQAEILVAEAINSLDNKLSLEYVSQGIKDALLSLDELLGKSFSEDLLDKIFSEFCIGK